MFKIVRRPALIALALMTLMVFGAVSAEARNTHGADRLVKGAVLGAAVGTVTQIVRGRNQGRELLKGAAVGGAVGAAVGAYSDYRQERNARLDEQRYYRYGDYRGYRDYRGYQDYRGSRSYRNRGGYYTDYRPAYYTGNGRGHRGGKHRCR